MLDSACLVDSVHRTELPAPADSEERLRRPSLPRRIDLAGAELGALFVSEFVGVTRTRMALWRAECRLSHGGCGAVVVARGADLQHRSSCGCREHPRTRWVSFDGLTLSLAGWERELRARGMRLSRETLKTRLRAGWPVRRALTMPVQGRVAAP